MESQLKKLCDEYASLRNEKSELEAKMKSLNILIDEKNKELLQHWTNEGLTNVKFDEHGTFYLNKSTRASCTNQDVLFDYLKENGHEGLIKTTIPHQTLSSWANTSGLSREALENIGVSIYEDYQIRIRK